MHHSSNLVNRRLGNYRLIQRLGRGGFAEVYLGEHIHLKTLVAVKVLLTQLTQETVETFRREAQTIARLRHPSIVQVHDFGIEDDTAYLVMDYAPHGTLRQRQPKGTVFPLVTVVSYVKQVAEGLQYAHEQRLIHRDVKPENMLLGPRQEVLLSDFGIALTAHSSFSQNTQNVAGTIVYMAPEQIQGHARPASDQYALGVVVYEWLCGNRPFQGTFTEIALQHTTKPPPPLRLYLPALPVEIEQVVMTALQKDPQQRFSTVRARGYTTNHACHAALFPAEHSSWISARCSLYLGAGSHAALLLDLLPRYCPRSISARSRYVGAVAAAPLFTSPRRDRRHRWPGCRCQQRPDLGCPLSEDVDPGDIDCHL